MEKILGVFGGVPSQASRNDDDFTDRLSYRYTSLMLVVAALVVSTKQYVGDPINCWVPAHFTGNHEDYANSYCWIRNTYYLPFEEYVPQEDEPHLRHMIPYYQWVPMILLVSALIFYLPVMVWRTMNKRSGIDVNNIVESAETFQNTEKAKDRDKTMLYMTKQMHRYLTNQVNTPTACVFSIKNIFSRTCCACCGRRHGNYLIALYMFCKILFIANVVGQLFVMSAFLGWEFHLYGFEVIAALARGEDWTQSSRFPRVTMCDLKIRRLGNIQRYTVQCVLPINLFNEAIFLFLWFWFVLVATLTCLSFLTWLIKSISKSGRVDYVQKHLELTEKLEEESSEHRERAEEFTNKYLQEDGVFVMRLVGHNTNAITVSEFIASLWDNYVADDSIQEE